MVYHALVWIFVNSFDIQGLIFFMKLPQSHISISLGNTSLESLNELKAHQKVERDKVGYWKVESLDELQEELIKGGKGASFRWIHQTSQGKGFGIAFQSVVRVRKRIQNPPR